eukprot:gnl/TRDRNA2_/TRDRNA2_86502_c0_seq1.p1 gnl/TRDRNA2_/TRDRNA2_86502_c0~~gnl/TRDRNA2_/TRDRNA2_86502_c0_seq1.p1  ORF type:complete len:239 (+),score=38.68 gnl/TRDRNA2_/TRDRNA2_86502_c0_seq1:47-718(+)
MGDAASSEEAAASPPRSRGPGWIACCCTARKGNNRRRGPSLPPRLGRGAFDAELPEQLSSAAEGDASDNSAAVPPRRRSSSSRPLRSSRHRTSVSGKYVHWRERGSSNYDVVEVTDEWVKSRRADPPETVPTPDMRSAGVIVHRPSFFKHDEQKVGDAAAVCSLPLARRRAAARRESRQAAAEADAAGGIGEEMAAPPRSENEGLLSSGLPRKDAEHKQGSSV